MINKVHSNPENIYVATEYKTIGKFFELNRQRVTNVIYSISRATSEAQAKKIREITEDNAVTDAEKQSLARELDALVRDFGYLTTETRNADLGGSDEYIATKEAYDRLVDLLTRIVNSVGTYNNVDVTYLSDYYNDYTDKAKTLETLILDTTAYTDRINRYKQLTTVDVIIYPEAVPVNTSASVKAVLMYDGQDYIDDEHVDADSVTFGLTGLSNSVTQATASTYFTIPSGGSITVSELTHTAEITGCKSFSISYNAIGSTAVIVNCSISLDSDSMPF